MIWIVLIVLVFVCLVGAIIYSNHNMKVKWDESTNMDVRFIREAAEHSVRASNTSNEAIALKEAVSAYRTIELFVRRCNGVQRATELSRIDCGEMLRTLSLQCDRIMQDLTTKYPHMLPKGELLAHAGFVKERNLSRESGVAHIEEITVQ